MPTKRFENLDPERRNAILDAARVEFGRSGFERASLNEIIRAAGISKGSLYYYFEDKLDLYMTIARQMMSEVMEIIGWEAFGGESDDFWGDLENLYERMMCYMVDHPEVVRFGWDARQLMHSPVVSSAFSEMMERGFEIFRDILRKGQQMGAVRTDVPLDLLASALYYMGEGMDFWVFDHWNELSSQERNKIMKFYSEFAKKIAGTSNYQGDSES